MKLLQFASMLIFIYSVNAFAGDSDLKCRFLVTSCDFIKKPDSNTGYCYNKRNLFNQSEIISCPEMKEFIIDENSKHQALKLAANCDIPHGNFGIKASEINKSEVGGERILSTSIVNTIRDSDLYQVKLEALSVIVKPDKEIKRSIFISCWKL